MRRRLLLWSCVCVASLGLGAPAWGQEDGVHVDPDSPAGKEYELPIEGARDRASPRGAKAAGEAPLFGEGVGSEDGGSSPGATSRRSDDSPAGASAAEEAVGKRATEDPEVARAQASAPETGIGQVLAIGAGAAGVLLVGGIGGLALRRRSRD